MCFNQQKKRTIVGFIHFSPSFLFACAAINWVNLAFRMTIIEDTHLTLAVIPFKVEANNSSFFSITNIQERIRRVYVPSYFLGQSKDSDCVYGSCVTLLSIPCGMLCGVENEVPQLPQTQSEFFDQLMVRVLRMLFKKCLKDQISKHSIHSDKPLMLSDIQVDR